MSIYKRDYCPEWRVIPGFFCNSHDRCPQNGGVHCSFTMKKGERLEEVQAKVIDGSSFLDYRESRLTIFCGDGSGKVKDTIKGTNCIFIDIESVAQGMIKLRLTNMKIKSSKM